MRIDEAQQVLLRTHVAALKAERRASGIMLSGGPGIGKSEGVFQSVEALARASGDVAGVVVEMLATYTSPDVRGFMMPVKGADGGLDTLFSTPAWYPRRHNTAVVKPDGTWHRLGTWDAPVPRIGCVFLDEWGQAEDEVKKPAAELLLNGRVGTCELPMGWRVVGATNRTSDRSGVLRELMFTVNRRCSLNIDASLPAWLAWANRQSPENRPHYLTISFAQKNPDIVFRDSVPDGTDPFCTPRTLCLMDRDLRSLRSEEDDLHDRLPLDDISREVAAGWVGGGAAAQFYTHLKYAERLPDIDDVIKDPAKAKLPDGLDVQMVLAYMLAHHVTEKTARPIMRYISRMIVEMQVLAVQAVNAQGDRAAAIMAQPEYVSWLMRNKELLIASRS